MTRQRLFVEKRNLEKALETVREEAEEPQASEKPIEDDFEIETKLVASVMDKSQFLSEMSAKMSAVDESPHEADLSLKTEKKRVQSGGMPAFDMLRDHLGVMKAPEIWKVVQEKEKSKLNPEMVFSQTCEYYDAKMRRRAAVLVVTSKRHCLTQEHLLYLFDSRRSNLKMCLNYHRMETISVSQANFSVMSFESAGRRPRKTVLETLHRDEMLTFMEKVLCNQIFEMSSRKKRPQILVKSNLEICPKIGDILNSRGILESPNLIWKSTQLRTRVDMLSRGVFSDSWTPKYLTIYPEFMVLHRPGASSEQPVVIALSK